MGQVLACCTVNEREANDGTIYLPPPQEIAQSINDRKVQN